ncbi:MAG: hypothetical protein LBS31_03360 [Candidatus Adiutrix sp.]|jgi:hypothetical protein|nr:hypothetical protein [Candidatus Adiutrix sp.]
MVGLTGQAGETEKVRLARIGFWAWRLLARYSKKRNKNLLERLALWNREVRPPEAIVAELGLSGEDMAFLAALGRRPDGWQACEFASDGYEAVNLARLGLILLKPGPGPRRISLADAGRFLLVLTRTPPRPSPPEAV